MAALTAARTVRRRRAGTLATLLMLGLAATPQSSGAAAPSLEMAVKASYLYKFAPFVQWPSRTFTSATSPLRICVVGDDAIGGVLDQAVRGQRIQEHPIAVARLNAVDAAAVANCQILFLGKPAAAEMLRGVAGQPVLTVTDRGSGGSGGIIQFVTMGGRVRFAVDVTAANSAGIQISSKLLGLAVEVAR